MGKTKQERRLADNEAQAVTRNIRISPQKLNLVATSIRGKKVEKALADLTFSRKRIAKDVKKTLESAIANAENNHGLDVDSLVVSEAFVGKGYYMIVEDTHAGNPGHPIKWKYDNEGAYEAVEAFLKMSDDFEVDYNCERHLMTFNPKGYLRRIK